MDRIGDSGDVARTRANDIDVDIPSACEHLADIYHTLNAPNRPCLDALDWMS